MFVLSVSLYLSDFLLYLSLELGDELGLFLFVVLEGLEKLLLFVVLFVKGLELCCVLLLGVL